MNNFRDSLKAGTYVQLRCGKTEYILNKDEKIYSLDLNDGILHSLDVQLANEGKHPESTHLDIIKVFKPAYDKQGGLLFGIIDPDKVLWQEISKEELNKKEVYDFFAELQNATDKMIADIVNLINRKYNPEYNYADLLDVLINNTISVCGGIYTIKLLYNSGVSVEQLIYDFHFDKDCVYRTVKGEK